MFGGKRCTSGACMMSWFHCFVLLQISMSFSHKCNDSARLFISLLPRLPDFSCSMICLGWFVFSLSLSFSSFSLLCVSLTSLNCESQKKRRYLFVTAKRSSKFVRVINCWILTREVSHVCVRRHISIAVCTVVMYKAHPYIYIRRQWRCVSSLARQQL